MATTTYLDVPRLFMIHHYGLGVVDSSILWFAVIGAAIAFGIRRTAAAALIGSLVGLAIGCFSAGIQSESDFSPIHRHA